MIIIYYFFSKIIKIYIVLKKKNDGQYKIIKTTLNINIKNVFSYGEDQIIIFSKENKIIILDIDKDINKNGIYSLNFGLKNDYYVIFDLNKKKNCFINNKNN